MLKIWEWLIGIYKDDSLKMKTIQLYLINCDYGTHCIKIPPSTQQHKHYQRRQDQTWITTTSYFCPCYWNVDFLFEQTVLQYGIRKLAHFNALPGKKHFKALINLLHHVWTHKLDYGMKFYSPESNPPIYYLVKCCQPDFWLFCLSSLWKDCVDTGRSTGAYYIYLNGSFP